MGRIRVLSRLRDTQLKISGTALLSGIQTRGLWGRGYNGVGERHAGLLHSSGRAGKDVAAVYPVCGLDAVRKPTVQASACLIQSYTARLRTERLC